ncbi:uncharacterized protein LOC62_04G005315 [Vanrija pseudolonga]|uniref:Uncharacterized protein n=1 Tax=Vanrija pseudolonga TaxID=143232 RepID=A0AAF1BM90_9TREE|nr:hypothetical protein LOC62_04G005315 [Vanrija pseudolonga]
MPVTIDHTAYPYIMDLIIDNSDVDALLKLRATCKLFCKRITTLLFTHVSLVEQSMYEDKDSSNDDEDTSNDDQGTSNDDQGTRNYDEDTSNDDEDTSNDDEDTSNDGTPPSKQPRLVLLPPLFFLSGNGINDAIDDVWPPPSLPFFPDPVQVLDIDLRCLWHDQQGSHDALNKLSRFTNVTTVRRFGARTASIIGDIPFGVPRMKCVDYLDTEGLSVDKSYHIGCIPGVASHVIHLQWRPGCLTNIDFLLKRTGDLQDVTLVLWPSYHFKDENVEPAPSCELWSILESLESAIQRGVSLTIVGADKLEYITDKPLEDDEADHGWMSPQEKLLQNLLFKLSSVWDAIPEEDIDATMAHVKCVTMPEWPSNTMLKSDVNPPVPRTLYLYGRSSQNTAPIMNECEHLHVTRALASH